MSEAIEQDAEKLYSIAVMRLTDRCADLDDKCARLEDALRNFMDWAKEGADRTDGLDYAMTEAEMALRSWRVFKLKELR